MATMNIQFGPNSVDEPNLLYKIQRKIKVFNTANQLSNRGYNLVANSSKYGIVFTASPDGILSVYYLKQLINKAEEPLHFELQLQEKPTHIAVSCDQEFLAVTGGQLLTIYKVTDFQNQNASPCVSINFEVNPSTFVCALQWNPCVPDNIAIAFYDGTLLVSQVTNSQIKKVQSRARCICWSPKGKQLVTGNSDGTLCQYKPDLTPAKLIPAPNLFEGAPVEALAIYWISTFQFAVVYKNAANESRPVVTIVNTPKAGQPSCFNYEDICYSMGSNRPWYYYLQGLAQWNMILCSSSNSMEIATLGSADGASWLQWCQIDEARPELPLTDKKQENYPVGICIDTCAIHQLPWGENETLPPMPLLLVVSQTGLLTIFNVINLKKEAVQICAPPQQLTLPDAAMISDIPGALPTPVQPAPPTPTPVALPKPQPTPQSVQPQHVQPPQPTQPPQSAFGAPTSQFGSILTGVSNKPSFQPSSANQGFVATSTPQVVNQKPVEVKPAAPPQVPAPAQQKPTAKASSQAEEVNAALRAEQEKMNKLKADQELRSMLVKEVNDFQMELYKFVVKTKDVQSKLQRDIDSIDSNFNFQSLDTEKLRKDCSMDDLRAAIVQLKLELVRACAVVAEARTHAEAKDLDQWTQADPLTTKRVASVKKLAYYVQTQLEHAHKALDYKWNEMISRDPQFNKPGHRMIRPILDDVYQPLVKQQEILSRQQAVLRTLRNTLKDCDGAPMFKSTSLLRSTPFRNKDPLSKLTKNILNMSIESQTNKAKEGLFTPQKLDALRDMLSNHKPVKIKPVNVELRQHLAAMRLNYEKSVKEKAQVQEITIKKEPPTQYFPVKTEPVYPQKQPTMQPAAPVNILKTDLISKPAVINVPSFTPVNAKPAMHGFANVARTLFTDEPKQEQTKPASKPQQPLALATPSPITATVQTRSALKDMLQNKQSNLTNTEPKSDANTFMGQKICAPTAFAFSTVPPGTAHGTSAVNFTSKPSDISYNMFNKFTPQTLQASKPKSDETGEVDTTESKPDVKKEQKPLTNLFAMKTSTPFAPNTQNVPDVLKSSTSLATVKPENKTVAEKVPQKSKENVPEKSGTPQVVPKSANVDNKENSPKPLNVASNKSSIFGSAAQSAGVPSSVTVSSSSQPSPDVKEKSTDEIPKPPENTASSPSSNASSIFAAANAAESVSKSPSAFGAPVSPTSASQGSIFGSAASSAPATSSTNSTSKESVATTTTPASVLFGSAAASQPFSTSTQASSIFTSTPSTKPSLFGSSLGSIFGDTTTSAPTSTTTAPPSTGTESKLSIFSSPSFVTTTTPSTPTTENKPSVFSTPTPSSPSSVFASEVTTTAPAFGSPSVFATAATQAPAFGSTTASVFGSTATQASVFGSPATTAQSVFGTSTSSSQSLFGAANTSIFGGTSPTTQASVFGTATTTPSVFAIATATTQASIFGGQAPQTSVFGGTSPSSVFGTATTQASVFGTTPATQASVFGSPPATTASGSLFGTDNMFASASISTTSASSPTSGGNIFGGSSTGSVFGSSSNTNVFGGKSSFGQSNSSAAAIFGGGAAAFGQQKPAPANDFWGGGGASTGSTFGSSGFGQTATTQASSIFGGSTGGSFSSPSGGQPFGSPQQGSVFGSPQQQAAPGGFGSSPGFGAKPAFGQSTGFGAGFGGFNKSPSGGFGAPASFGGGATFGGTGFGGTSPGKMFGGGGAAPGFGSPTQSNATFENLATQNTLTFGNLAQQTPQAPQQAPTFNTSPSFTGWRG